MMSATASEMKRPALWTPGDWNAFFGFGTNILVNMLVLTGLLRFVLKMPDSLVFGRILPALGLMMCLSTMYYAFLAYRLALRTGRNDVCALPSGVSVPHMFIVTFVIMLPIALKPHDPIKCWYAGRFGRRRGRTGDRLGLHHVRPRLWRPEPRRPARRLRQLRFLGADPGRRPCVLGLRVPRRDPGRRHPIRHLRPGRGHGQRRER